MIFFFFFNLPVVAVLPTPGTGILVNSGQTLEVGCPFSLLMPYWFIFALISYVGMAVAEIAERMPVNGGTIVNHSYLRRYSLTMLVWSKTTNIIVSPGLFARDCWDSSSVSVLVRAQSGCVHAPTVFRRHKSGVLSIVNGLAASSFQQVPEDLVILVYTGMVSLSLLYFGHWQNSRLHGASSLGSRLGPGQTRVDQGSRRELQAIG